MIDQNDVEKIAAIVDAVISRREARSPAAPSHADQVAELDQLLMDPRGRHKQWLSPPVPHVAEAPAVSSLTRSSMICIFQRCKPNPLWRLIGYRDYRFADEERERLRENTFSSVRDQEAAISRSVEAARASGIPEYEWLDSAEKQRLDQARGQSARYLKKALADFRNIDWRLIGLPLDRVKREGLVLQTDLVVTQTGTPFDVEPAADPK